MKNHAGATFRSINAESQRSRMPHASRGPWLMHAVGMVYIISLELD